MQATRIPYPSTHRFSSLVEDYLAQREKITPFFGNPPTLAGFTKQLELKRDFSPEIRKTLVARLAHQYASLPLAEDARAELYERISLLKKENTYTVTTGHQLCLFTGPLYTVYKIMHVIRLAEELSEKLDGATVLPIFWMASEDHDFDEVNHIRYHGHKIVWHNEPGDAVGRMKTQGVAPVIETLRQHFPNGDDADRLLAELQDAYLKQDNLADATRAIVHKWFGHLGIICLDGDDAELKLFMVPAFQQEMIDKVAFTAVTKSNEALAEHYGIQVNPRDINLFYLRDGQRNRLTLEGENYTAVGSNWRWTKAEILAELSQNPERFSPNVMLRPLYQETILPNLGYIGGGGEVAYWAQLKQLFQDFGVPFPIVVLRQSVQLVPKFVSRKLEKLEISITDLFTEQHALARMIVSRQCDYAAEINGAEKEIAKQFAQVIELATKTDASLVKHVLAQEQKSLNSLRGIEKKMYRAAKRHEGDTLRMLQECRDVLQPGGGLQERHDNILQHLLAFGPQLLDEIYSQIEPLQFDFLSLNEA